MNPPASLTDELIEYGLLEKRNIHKETTNHRNLPLTFMGGGNLGELLTLEMYPNTIGSASKGGMAFDNKTLDISKNTVEAKEVKFVSLVGTKQCKYCTQKAPRFQPKCIYCDNCEFKLISDSRAGISSNAHILYKNILNEYIIFVQDYNVDTKIIGLKAFKFLTKNTYFDSYIQNQYDCGGKLGGSCNFIPYSFDWNMSGAITIMDVSIDISNEYPIVTYHFYNPLSDEYDKIDLSTFKPLLRPAELAKLENVQTLDGYLKYEDIVSLFSLRNKSIGKSRGTVTRK
jgi:hypothetical protein